MSANRRSRNVTQGIARSANRAMYYAMGYKDDDFDKPMIGVANGHSTITPCNAGLQKLADAAIEEITACQANAQVFGVPTISDGIGMGTEGMKYSLVSREVIADCIETCVNGQWLDGVIVIGGCDKNMPGGMIGMARANVPSIYVYGGTVKPGHYKGKDLTIVSAFEAVGELTAGRLSETDFKEIERRCIPGSGSCGGMYSANTMSSSFEALGLALLGSSTMANPDDEIVERTRLAARTLVEAVKNNIRPSDIITRQSIENAVALIMAAAPTPCCTSWRSPMPRGCSGRSTISSGCAARFRCSATSSLRASTSPPTCTRPAASRWCCACCSTRACCTATA